MPRWSFSKPWGMAQVEKTVLAHAAWLRARLREGGMEVCPTDGQSGIVPFRHPSRSNDEVLAQLESQNIWAAVRCGWVRFSPHAYTKDEDLERALAALLKS